MPGPYTYDNTIPDANNDPAVDQPLMLLNFQSIEALINEDHVDFNQATAGQHKKVSFPAFAAPVPAPANAEGSLYTADIGGSIAGLFFKNSASTFNLTHDWAIVTNGTNHGFKLPNGIIVNYGESNNVDTQGGARIVTLAIPFTTTAYYITATAFDQNGETNLSASRGVFPNDLTTIRLYANRPGGSSNNPAFYLAIGV